MSAPLINRSLTTIRTELEFLQESEVITEGLYKRLLAAIPSKYDKNSPAWGEDKLDDLSSQFAKTAITNNIEPPKEPPRSFAPKPVGYCKALYDYTSSEADDLSLSKGDLIAVTEHLSEDWWKGYKRGTSAQNAGVFPSNYVSVVSDQEFESSERSAEKTYDRPNYTAPQQSYSDEKARDSYAAPAYNPPAQYGYQQYQPPPVENYAQYPPPSTNYYQPPQPQPVQVQVEQPEKESSLKKFGSKFGNAAIFGAGATLGGDLVNSIF